MIKNLHEFSVLDLGNAFLKKAIDPVDALDYFLSRIKNFDDKNIFITILDKRARKEAEASALRYSRSNSLGLLDGVPVAWKDLIDVAGSKTTRGSEILRNSNKTKVDAAVVANCSSIGMVALGKVNLTEFAFSGLGINPNYGTPLNPFGGNIKCVPGGSSSGSAVAVSTGLSPIAVGTDTGGSVRIPASFNGLVGYKPSEGYLNKTGVWPLAHTLDTVGPIGKSFADCLLMLKALKGDKLVFPIQGNIKELTLLIPKNYVFENTSDDVLKNFEKSMDKLSLKGVKIKKYKFDVFNKMLDVSKKHGTIATAESYYNLKKFVGNSFQNEIDSRVLSRINMGKDQSSFDYITISESRKKHNVEIGAVFDQSTFIVMPTVAITAPEISPLENNVELFHKTNMLVLRNTMVGNYFNLPGLSLPNGLDKNGLPTGILFSAFSNMDEQLFKYGLCIENALNNSY